MLSSPSSGVGSRLETKRTLGRPWPPPGRSTHKGDYDERYPGVEHRRLAKGSQCGHPARAGGWPQRLQRLDRPCRDRQRPVALGDGRYGAWGRPDRHDGSARLERRTSNRHRGDRRSVQRYRGRARHLLVRRRRPPGRAEQRPDRSAGGQPGGADGAGTPGDPRSARLRRRALRRPRSRCDRTRWTLRRRRIPRRRRGAGRLLRTGRSARLL